MRSSPPGVRRLGSLNPFQFESPCTVSSEILEPDVVDRFEGLKKSTAQLRSECEGFQGFVADTLEQLEVMRGKLAEREGWVQAEYERIDEQREAVTRLRDDFDRSQGDSSELEKTILDLRQELGETKEALEAQCQHADRCEAENNESHDRLTSLQQELEASEAERGHLKAACEQLKAERGADTQDSEGFADVVSKLDETQQRLDEARQELDATRIQLSDAREEQERNRVSGPAGEPAVMRELEEEREALEAELEQARHRAAELANAVAEQKQQFVDERTGWTAELGALRALKDMHAPVSITASASKATSESDQVASPSPAGIGSSDPVVGSVLAQFAKLQKNVASRRSDASE